MSISVILLAGGKGSRMNAPLPKQYLELGGKLIAHHSLELFLSTPAVHEVIVVCEPGYEHHFCRYQVKFARPGIRRQDSLENGLALAKGPWICTHDSVRPFVTPDLLERLFHEGKQAQAAALGVPMKWTVKVCNNQKIIEKTLGKEQVWEAQTPQLISKDLLLKGFAFANQHNLTVTDDVALVELLGHPVKMVQGAYNNVKITTPEDLALAEHYLHLQAAH